MSPNYSGNSSVQLEAESVFREILGKKYGPLVASVWPIDENTSIEIDAVNAERSVLIEIFAKQGPLRSGQKKKIATDILKLALVGSEGGMQKRKLIIAHANSEIARLLTTETWIASAMRKFDIVEVNLSAELTADFKKRIEEAQITQYR